MEYFCYDWIVVIRGNSKFTWHKVGCISTSGKFTIWETSRSGLSTILSQLDFVLFQNLKIYHSTFNLMCSIKQFLVYPIYIHCNTIFTILCNQNVEEVDIDLKYLCFFSFPFFMMNWSLHSLWLVMTHDLCLNWRLNDVTINHISLFKF